MYPSYSPHFRASDAHFRPPVSPFSTFDSRYSNPSFYFTHSTTSSAFYPPTLAHSSRTFYNDEDDSYGPYSGPAAMPSPHSPRAPYFSGRSGTFEDSLDDFEGLAYGCDLTDPQRVDTIMRYVDRTLRDLWKSLDGFRSRDWPLFRQSLIDIFGSTTPRHQATRHKLVSLVQDTSRRRMNGADDVMEYYRTFLIYSGPLVHAGHLTGEDRDAYFWHGFHPEDRNALQPRLLGKNPFQLQGVPFNFEDVYDCARAAFAYGDDIAFWSQKSNPPNPKSASAVASNAEAVPVEPSSQSIPDFQISLSPSLPAPESQREHAHSVTVDQPDQGSLPISILPLLTSPARSSTDHGAEIVFASSNSQSLLLCPSSSSVPPSPVTQPEPPVPQDLRVATSVVASNAEIVPIESSSPSQSPSVSQLAPSSPLSVSESQQTHAHSAMVDQSGHEPVSTSIPLPSTSPAHSSTVHVSEIAAAPLTTPASHAPFDSLSLAHSAPDEVPEHTPMLPSASITSTGSELLSPESATEDLPEPEPEHTPSLLITSTPPTSSLESSCTGNIFEPPSYTEDIPLPVSIPLIPRSASTTPSPELAPSLPPSKIPTPKFDMRPSLPPDVPSRFPVDFAPSLSSFSSPPVVIVSSELALASLSRSLVPGGLQFECNSVPVPIINITELSSPEQGPSSLIDTLPPLSAPPFEVSTNTPISPISSPPQHLLDLTPDDFTSQALEKIPTPTSPTVSLIARTSLFTHLAPTSTT